MRRGLSADWHYGEKNIIEIDMSESQWGSFLSSFNTQGVPCTLHYTEKDGHIPLIKTVDKKSQLADEFRKTVHQTMEQMKALVSDANEILDKKSVNKGDRTELKSKLRLIKQEIESNMPFVMDSFNEQMDKTVAEGKSEVDAVRQNFLNKLGVDKMEEVLKVN